MRKLLELIEKLYGETALSKTLGTRTNVITLADAYEKKLLKKGDLIGLVGFGGGLSYGATLLKWAK